MKKYLLVFITIITTLLSHGQTINVSGTVFDSQTGETMPGVSIVEDGTNNGTTTDAFGIYNINVAYNSILSFSFIGYETLKINAVEGKHDVTLSENIVDLDEVVVIGYGTAKKRDLTGAIVNVKGEEISNSPNGNPISSLQGKVAGLTVTTSGAAGSSPNVKIRGIATINSDTSPLYVVDGVFTSNISFLNPDDIQSMEILKDASSLAIFGVQAANGVIIITTKNAEKGKLNVSYSGYEGIQIIPQSSFIDMANASQFTELYNEQLQNMAADSGEPYQEWIGDLLGKGTDWQDLIVRQGAIRNHNISISNGTDKSNTLLSLGYFKQEGVYKYDDYERFNLRFKNDFTINKHLKVGGSIIANSYKRYGYVNKLSSAVKSLPTYSPYDGGLGAEDEIRYNTDGTIQKNSNFPGNPTVNFSAAPEISKQVGNPLADVEVENHTSVNEGYDIIGTGYIEITFLKDFTAKSTGYAKIWTEHGSNYNPKYHVSSMQNRPDNNFSRHTSTSKSYQVDNLLSYNKEIGKHRINALLGLNYREQIDEGFNAGVDSLAILNYNADRTLQMLSLWSDKQRTFIGDYYSKYTFISYMTRLLYTYNNKYMINATYRRDGSSKFGPEERFGNFGSIGAAWIVTEEKFMKNFSALNMLKLRASYGKLGNDKIGNYRWLSPINPKGIAIIYGGNTYYLPTYSYLADKNLHWEVVTGTDIGIEGQLLNSRLSFDIGYFNKVSSDLLLVMPAPVNGAYNYAITNAGSMRNTGLELVLSWRDNVGDNFSYSVSANASYLNNKVIDVASNKDIIAGDHVTRTGEAIAQIYGYVQEGIYQSDEDINSSPEVKFANVKPGDIKFKDTNKDGVIDPKDRVLQGNYLPDWTYGFSLNAAYKGIDLTIDLNGVVGTNIYNTMMSPSTYAQFNYHSDWNNRWTGEGTSNEVPILAPRANNFVPSSFFKYSGDYLRVRNIQLGYNFSKKIINKINVKKLRVYINAQNPLLFTSYKGFTPEIQGSTLEGGRDNLNSYPQPATFSVGVNMNF